MTVNVELTDPAKELRILAEKIVGAKGGGTTVNGLAALFNVSAGNLEFLELLAAVYRRILDVDALVHAISDTDFDQDHRRMVSAATKGFAALLHPQHGGQPWDNQRKSLLPAQHITALGFFSQTARRYRPLRVIPIETRSEALTRLQDAITSIKSDPDLQEWVRLTLIQGLDRISLVLRHFDFFGHDAAIAELFQIHHRISVVVQKGVEPAKRDKSSALKAVATLSLIANLFMLPDQALTALERYQGWYTTVSAAILASVAEGPADHQQRLLPPPYAMLPAPPNEKNGPDSDRR